MKITYASRFTPAQMAIAREYCADMAENGCFRDVDADWVRDEATEEEISREIERCYGISSWLYDYTTLTA